MGELLEHANVPMAWFLGGRDRSAPNEQTIARLESMIETGKPYELVVYPDADHGMLLFNERDGERVNEGYAAAYFRSGVDAIRRLAE